MTNLSGNNRLRTWRQDGFRCDLYDLGYDSNQGRHRLGYTFFDNSKLIFAGEEFSPSPLIDINSICCVMDLLQFLSLEKGDVEEEHFDKYTTLQLEWRNRAEDLVNIVFEYQEQTGNH